MSTDTRGGQIEELATMTSWAAALGVTRQRVHQKMTKGSLPDPDFTARVGEIDRPFWRYKRIDEYLARRQTAPPANTAPTRSKP